MPGTYQLRWDFEANRLEFTLTGIFDEATYDEWDAAVQAAVKKAPRPGWTMLGDMTQFPPQKDEIQKRAEGMIGYVFANGGSKTALIASKTVIAMQAKRLAGNVGAAEKLAFVATRQEALDWLSGKPTTVLR